MCACAFLYRGLFFAKGGVRGLPGGWNSDEVLHRHLDAAPTLTAGESRVRFHLFVLSSVFPSDLLAKLPFFCSGGAWLFVVVPMFCLFFFCCIFSLVCLLPIFSFFSFFFLFSFFFFLFLVFVFRSFGVSFFLYCWRLCLFYLVPLYETHQFCIEVFAPACVCVPVRCELRTKVGVGVLRVCRSRAGGSTI